MIKLLLVILIAAAVVFGTATASGRPSTIVGSILLTQTSAAFGDSVTFTTTADGFRNSPMVQLICTQLGSEVYSLYTYTNAGIDQTSYPSDTLSSSTWTSGKASCIASLGWLANGRLRVQASTSFAVSA